MSKINSKRQRPELIERANLFSFSVITVLFTVLIFRHQKVTGVKGYVGISLNERLDVKNNENDCLIAGKVPNPCGHL